MQGAPRRVASNGPQQVPKHARGVAQDAQGTASAAVPVDRHLGDHAACASDELDEFDVKRESLDSLRLEDRAHLLHLEQLEPALRIVDAAHADEPDERVVQA